MRIARLYSDMEQHHRVGTWVLSGLVYCSYIIHMLTVPPFLLRTMRKPERTTQIKHLRSIYYIQCGVSKFCLATLNDKANNLHVYYFLNWRLE